MTPPIPTSQYFKHLVAELFTKLGFTDVKTDIEFSGSLDHDYFIDILFGTKLEATVAEVKHYRYTSPPRIEPLRRALLQARTIRSEAGAKKSILVISCPLTSELAIAANDYPDVEICDAHLLIKQSLPFPDLLDKFEQIFEVSTLDALYPPIRIASDDFKKEDEPPGKSKGRILSDALKAIKPGREMATDFENNCIAALKYLFDRDLFGWHEQQETEDGLQRRDLVCRILPNSEFWHLMLTDFKSRYVIFEFKNYSEPITQNEIITTERYLYPSAFRKVAIIISPRGCTKSARKVIQGAMRENGKLIILLTTDELITLLKEKDTGSDPNVYIFERVDDFLMSLGR